MIAYKEYHRTVEFDPELDKFHGRVVNTRSVISFYGTGDQRRSFCHVDDSVRAVLGLLDAPEAVGQAFNIGNEHEISMMELAERVRARVNSPSEIVLVLYEEAYGEGFEDMERRQPDITKINGLLGWRPENTIDQIIDDVVAYYGPKVLG